MVEDITTTLTVQNNEGIDYADSVCYSDSEKKFVKSNNDRTLENISDMINIIKTKEAISKKESDTCAYISKKHTDMEVVYIESLREQKRRKNITPEEMEEIDERIERGLLRMEVQEQEKRKQLEKSPYRKIIDWTDGVLILSALYIGYALGRKCGVLLE